MNTRCAIGWTCVLVMSSCRRRATWASPRSPASCIKVMSNLDIAERRLPQDGRIELGIGGNSVDIRVSTLPTLFGESVVLRILDRTVVNLDLEKIGMPADTPYPVARDHPQAEWHHSRHRPHVFRQRRPRWEVLRHAQRAELDRGQDHHHRGAGRIRHRRAHPGADQQRDRRHVRRLSAGHPAARSRQDLGRRDA